MIKEKTVAHLVPNPYPVAGKLMAARNRVLQLALFTIDFYQK
jgi:hypothetical protein